MSKPDQVSVPGQRLQRLLGEGACGRVYETVREGGRVCAVKALDPDAINYAYVAYCFGKLRDLPPHPCLAPVLTLYTDEPNSSVHYVMPMYAEADPAGRGLIVRSLEACCGRVPPETAWQWISEMAEGLAFLHLHAVVHCNFKTSNVFIDTEGGSQRAVVADPGQGWIGGVEALPLTDHVLYAPPEQLRRPTEIRFGVGERWDVYAFGVTAYRLLTGRFPRGQAWTEAGGAIDLPDPVDFAAVVEQETCIKWPEATADEIESARRAVVDKCLRLAPAERWVDMREVRDALAAVDQQLAAQAAQAAQAAWEAERDAWRAAVAEAGAPGSGAAAAGRRSARSAARPAGWLGRAAAGAAAVAAFLGVTLIFEHIALRGARGLAATQAADLERLAAERAEGYRSRDLALDEARQTLDAAVSAARQVAANLEGSQEAAEWFFGSFLEAAAQLPAEGERTRLLLSGYNHFSTFIAENSHRPELAVSLLRARCHLATVKLALGAPKEAADKFDDARAHITAFLSAQPDHADAPALRLRAADCLLQAGRLRLEAGQTDPAIFSSLAAALTDVAAACEAAGDPPDLLRRVAEGEMVLAQAELARVSADLPGATARAQHAADITHRLLGDPRFSQPGDKVRLGRVLLLRGRLERRTGDIELALSTQVETAQTLLECGDQPEALDLLAQCYGETGSMLHANGEARDAARAHGEAVKILSDLVKTDPARPDFRLALAARYGDLGQILRENGQASRALDYQQGAVDLLQALLARDAGNVALATTLARLRADLSELLSGLDKKTEALEQAREALVLLDRLDLRAPPVTTVDLSYRVAVARSYGVVGEVAEEAKQLAQARTCFEKAIVHFESAAAASPKDGAIDRGLTEYRMRLARLPDH